MPGSTSVSVSAATSSPSVSRTGSGASGRRPSTIAAMGVDDLLVEQVAHDAKHVLVGMIRREMFVLEKDAVKGDGPHLVVAYGQPGPAAAQKMAIDSGGMDEGDDGGVFERTELAPL